jgi:hypothetical protein
MKTAPMVLVGWSVACMAFAGCDSNAAEDDADTVADTAADTEEAPLPDPADIEGDWLAENDAIGEAFQADVARLISILSSFSADGSFTNDLTFDDGTSLQISGPYTVDASTYPWGILLDQQVPAPDTLGGIATLEGDVLRLDIVSTLIAEPVTPEQGIGGSALGETTVITFQRQ